MNQITDYHIESTDKPAGPHWDSLRDPREHLAEILRDLAAFDRITRGEEGNPDEDYARLGFDYDPDADPYEVLDDFVNGWALDMTVDPSRVQFLLGTGGPHVELDVLRGSDGRVEEIILRRRWTEHDRAWTDDANAIEAMEGFLAYVVPE